LEVQPSIGILESTKDEVVDTVMLRKSADGTRVYFGFPEAVMTSFRFLVEEFRFACVKQDATIVRFESNEVFVNIYHGRASYELGVEIGQLRKDTDVPECGFTLGEIISVADSKIGSMYRPYQISMPQQINKFVSETAELVRRYATSALIGDRAYFQRLSDLRVRISNAYIKEMELSRIRTDVEVAWREKNYKQVVELYGAVEDDLTSSEIKKLGYAKRKLREMDG
jgi:hypothetical protein